MTATYELALRGSGGEAVDLFCTINSHGFADLPPMRLDESQRVLEMTIPIAGARPRRVRIGGGRPGRARVEVLGPAPPERVARRIVDGVRHVLRLDADLSGFYEKAAETPTSRGRPPAPAACCAPPPSSRTS